MSMMMMIAQMLSVGVKGGVCVWQSIIVSLHIHAVYAFSALTLLVGRWKGIRPVKNWVWCAVVVVCLELGADLHMAQLMSLPLTVSCFSKTRLVLPFWYRLTWVVPDKGPLNVCVCLCVYTSMQWYCAADAVARQLTWRKSMTYSSPTLWNSQSVVLRLINLLPFWLVCTAQL